MYVLSEYFILFHLIKLYDNIIVFFIFISDLFFGPFLRFVRYTVHTLTMTEVNRLPGRDWCVNYTAKGWAKLKIQNRSSFFNFLCFKTVVVAQRKLSAWHPWLLVLGFFMADLVQTPYSTTL